MDAAYAGLEPFFPKMQLTDREKWVLTAAVVELRKRGYDPFEDIIVIQVDHCLVNVRNHRSINQE